MVCVVWITRTITCMQNEYLIDDLPLVAWYSWKFNLVFNFYDVFNNLWQQQQSQRGTTLWIDKNKISIDKCQNKMELEFCTNLSIDKQTIVLTSIRRYHKTNGDENRCGCKNKLWFTGTLWHVLWLPRKSRFLI